MIELIQYNTIQYNTIQYNTIQYNTIQYNTIQYNTIQYNTTQHNTMAIHDTSRRQKRFDSIWSQHTLQAIPVIVVELAKSVDCDIFSTKLAL